MSETETEPDESVAYINAELIHGMKCMYLSKGTMSEEEWSNHKEAIHEEREDIMRYPFPERWYEIRIDSKEIEVNLGFIIQDVEYLKNLVTSLNSTQDVIEQYCIIQKISTALMEECTTTDDAVRATADRIQFLSQAIARMTRHLKSINAHKEAM